MPALPPLRVGRTDLPTFIADDQRRVLSANPAALRLVGARADQLVGMRLDDILPADDRRHAPSLWWAVTTGGSLAGRLPFQRAGGRPSLIEFVSTYDHQRRLHEVRMMPVADEARVQRLARERRRLSMRELEVLTLAARGFTGAQIAAQLHLSESTVETHARRAVRAVGALNRVHAVALAIGRGLIEPPRS